MELVTGQNFYYSNKEQLPIEDIAETLLAFKALIDATPRVLEQLFPSLQIQHFQVQQVRTAIRCFSVSAGGSCR